MLQSGPPVPLPPSDALVLVYAIDERRSWHYVLEVLTEARRGGHRGAVITVANKADLARSREVDDTGG